jgi:hypothetical protein
MCSYSCSRRVSLKVVLNLCHKIGFEVAKLPPQTRWRRPSFKLSLSPAELRGAKRLGQGRAPRAQRRAPALPRRARQATKPCRVRGGLREPAGSPPAVHTAVCTAVHIAVCTAVHTAVCTAGGEPAGSRSPPPDAFFLNFFLKIKIKIVSTIF